MSTYTKKPIRITGVAVGELEFSRERGGGLHVKAAFVDEKGNTHGWTAATTWSTETIKKLDELVESIELDLLNRHFEISHEEKETDDAQGTEDRGRGSTQF